MTYPGTQRRSTTALESSLISQVVELEKERDELVEGIHLMMRYMQHTFKDDVYDNAVTVTPTSTVAVVRKLLARYPK